jgi:hypothetical protein
MDALGSLGSAAEALAAAAATAIEADPFVPQPVTFRTSPVANAVFLNSMDIDVSLLQGFAATAIAAAPRFPVRSLKLDPRASQTLLLTPDGTIFPSPCIGSHERRRGRRDGFC